MREIVLFGDVELRYSEEQHKVKTTTVVDVFLRYMPHAKIVSLGGQAQAHAASVPAVRGLQQSCWLMGPFALSSSGLFLPSVGVLDWSSNCCDALAASSASAVKVFSPLPTWDLFF